MSDTSLSRRAAIATLGAGGLTAALATRISGVSAQPAHDLGTTSGGGSADQGVAISAGSLHSESSMAAVNYTHATHPLKGLWLASVRLPSNPAEAVMVPGVFSGDGTVMLMFPVSDRDEAGVNLKGVAIGTWEPLDYQTGHFTVVQVLSDGDGVFKGSVTIDGYPKVLPGGTSFEDNSEFSVMTVRDSLNRVLSAVTGSVASSMSAARMSPGHAGFVETEYQTESPANPY